MNDTPRIDARPDNLSFVTSTPEGVGFDYWAVEGTGSYQSDCEKGRALGEEYLRFVGAYPTHGNRTLLGSIVNCMMVKRSGPNTHYGRHITGLELGFMSAVNEYALVSAAILMNPGILAKSDQAA